LIVGGSFFAATGSGDPLITALVALDGPSRHVLVASPANPKRTPARPVQ
jgi:hypothetical protein